VRLQKIGWVGTRTENAEAMAHFLGDVLGLRFIHHDDDIWVFQLPDGSKVEVFGPSENQHFTTGPVVEFHTDDVAAATRELKAAGTPIIFGPVSGEAEDDAAWVHFRGPDGNVYGITQGRDLEAPRNHEPS
jgi:catechol 2,3-dioxygenase-like lactoylglutathione lyase family enzyme